MKKQRQQALLQIVAQHVVETQEELLQFLRDAGFDVTQATISRDMKELRLIKALDAQGRYRYMSPRDDLPAPHNRYAGIFQDTVIFADYAMNNVVIKCHSGMANAACAALDQMDLSSIVGTLAGDDTILVVTRTEEQAQRLSLDIQNMLQ